jgi:cytochrome P450
VSRTLAPSRAAQAVGHRVPPGPPLHLLLGAAFDRRRDSLQLLTEYWHRYGDVVRFPAIRGRPRYLMVHPDQVQHVLQDRYKSFEKAPIYHKIDAVFGQSLLTADGSFWLRRRRLAQPAFQRERLAALAPRMTDACAALLERWQGYAERGQPVNLSAELMRLTLTMVARALFSVDLSDDVPTIAHAVAVGQQHTHRRMQAFLDLPQRLPLPANRRFRQAMRGLDTIVYRLIADRRRDPQRADDLLARLLEARDETTGQGLTDRQLRDEIVTILLAGHETTYVVLSWTFYLLSQHPESARRLRAELAQVLGGRLPTVRDLPSLPFTSLVFQETLRLYPPTWVFTRAPIEDEAIAGYHIPAGATIYLLPYLTHRHPAFWPEPERFDPDRFAPDRLATRPRFAYFPFGGGPRRCIGDNFALMETQLILASIAQTFQLDPVPGQQIAVDPLVTLQPRHDLLMRLSKVSPSATQPAAPAAQLAGLAPGCPISHA